MSVNVYENPPRHTARQVADDVAAGMDPDVELVAAQYYDALRAELARVKAESLRVVVDGDACDWEMLEDSDKDGLFVVDGKLYCRDRGTRNKIVDVSTGEAIHIYDEDGVQPVRLERWEDE